MRSEINSTVALTSGAAIDGASVLVLNRTASAGGYTLTFGGQTTAELTFDADASAIQNALQTLATIGPGNVEVGGGNPFRIEFTGQLQHTNVETITVDPTNLTGRAYFANNVEGSIANNETVDLLIAGNPATVYNNPTGFGLVVNPLVTNKGRVEGWVDDGSYVLVISGSTFTTYIEYIEAVSGSTVTQLAADLAEHKARSINAHGGLVADNDPRLLPDGGVVPINLLNSDPDPIPGRVLLFSRDNPPQVCLLYPDGTVQVL